MSPYRITRLSQSAIRHINRGYVRGGDIRFRQLSASWNKPAPSTTAKAAETSPTALKASEIPTTAPTPLEKTPAVPTTVATESAVDGVGGTKTTSTPVPAAASEAATSASEASIAPEAAVSSEASAVPEAAATSEASAKTGAIGEAAEEPGRLLGWKSYVGGVIATVLGYKNLQWYVARVAEEGRLKREEVETRKVERVKYDAEMAEMRAKHAATLAEMEAMGRANSISQAQAEAVQTTAVQAAKVPSLSTPYVPVEESKGFVSEADQLRSFRKELQAELYATSDGERRREIQEEIQELDAEIADIADAGSFSNSSSNSNSGIY